MGTATIAPMPTAYFIAGTDTGVGKTTIACALLQALALSGRSVVGMKPVAAGCVATPLGLQNEDVKLLCAASTLDAPPEWVNPYALRAAVAPHLAAEQDGVQLELSTMVHAFQHLQRLADVVIVEGVGGWMVPFNAAETSADLAQALNLPIILVVGMRLGCLSHALLTAQALQAQGLQLYGWVANHIDPDMALFDENVQTLSARLGAPLLGIVPHCTTASQTQTLVPFLNISLLG